MPNTRNGRKSGRILPACEGRKGDTPDALKVKKELDEIESLFSDDPAYVALLRAERNVL